ncbi:DUF2306 domain-containing protein [Agromyces ramosus]|uniref:Membrane protein n=1 Tax=Agromyces ramosus TaxID=33879 RepID=A0ABU0RAF9_9MICO|nr:DUF2306 domain-containing protein [Agromyces ramosus]MDQ0895053.1 putative membrane protein [Agromyces ramosus]
MTRATGRTRAPHNPRTPRTPRTRRSRSTRREWLAPSGLILLCLVPIAAGASRLGQLTAGAETSDNERFFDSPVPVIAHIVSVTVYCLLGALQFVPSLRRRPWHRRVGRVLLPAGLLAASTGLWMAFSPALPSHDGGALLVLRIVFGTSMIASLVLGFLAIRRGDVRVHSAWMTRAYAIALGAGTQVFTGLVGAILLGGEPDALAWAVLMGAGWVINLAVAEVVIRRRVAGSGPASRTSGRSAAASARLS